MRAITENPFAKKKGTWNNKMMKQKVGLTLNYNNNN